MKRKALRLVATDVLLVILSMTSVGAYADGIVVDKIYHPYVDALEKEIEYRTIFQEGQGGFPASVQLHKLSFGSAIGQNIFTEIYLLAEQSENGGFDIEGYELELKWQLTEQGEFSADWGVVFEYEHESDIEEIAVGLLVEKEWQRWSGTANLFLEREWGENIDNEFESSLSLQMRYRYSQQLEPALEFYLGEDYIGLGPSFMGNINLGIAKSMSWETGVVFGLSNKSPDQTFRLLVEYEF